jgi:glycosyltransferase involved in cell wall biosynthesis
MKLVIQIPCLNEEATIAVALGALPRQVPGFDVVEWLVIDDGSTDNTVAAAREAGVDHVVRHTGNQGLARAFMTGLRAALDLGADVIVNTDADNQYNADDIVKLVEPVVQRRADMVIGARPISSITHFSPVKRALQRLGSWVVRKASGTVVDDAPSGFRAISRAAAQRINVFNDYTYTLETIIQAGRQGLVVESVPIRVNDDLRPSRLVKSIFSYVRRSIITIVRIATIYAPFRIFFSVGAVVFLAGTVIGLRFVLHYLSGDGDGRIQSLILASALLVIGFQTILFAFMADLPAANRQLAERNRQEIAALRDEFRGRRAGDTSALASTESVSVPVDDPAAAAGEGDSPPHGN